MGNILVVGSLAYDSVRTPAGSVNAALGGSANYFGLAASLFAPVKVVGVVGEDYKAEDTKLLTDRGVDIEGIQKVRGKTFHWEGEYNGDLNEAKTLKTELNVFADFHPKLPTAYKKCEYVFLANIDPVLQLEVLKQIERPKLVAADTMNFWIQTKNEDLKKILGFLDILVINEGEARMLTEERNIFLSCEKISELGPKAIVIKRGEYGFVVHYGGDFFALPAFPVKNVVDPTGAGDSFAGGMMGYLARNDLRLEVEALKQAAVQGSLVASFTIQNFSVASLRELDLAMLERRHLEFKKVVSINY